VEDRISELKDEKEIKEKTEELLVKQLKTCERNINLNARNIKAAISSNILLKDLKTYIDSNTVVVETLISPHHQWIGHPNKKSIKRFSN
jgi:hypothetical protein